MEGKMSKLYLSEDKQATLMLRRLIAIDSYCGTMQMGFRMPQTSSKEKEAVNIVIDYARKYIKEQLKKCTEFSFLSNKEIAEESDTHDVSMITKATLGTCCVLAEEAGFVLEELQRLGKCKTIQEALKTGKNVIMII